MPCCEICQGFAEATTRGTTTTRWSKKGKYAHTYHTARTRHMRMLYQCPSKQLSKVYRKKTTDTTTTRPLHHLILILVLIHQHRQGSYTYAQCDHQGPWRDYTNWLLLSWLTSVQLKVKFSKAVQMKQLRCVIQERIFASTTHCRSLVFKKLCSHHTGPISPYLVVFGCD